MKHSTPRLPLLPMEPFYRTVVWGGKAIFDFKGEQAKGNDIGESWEVSDLEGCQSRVSAQGGELAGRELSTLCRDYAEALLGKRLLNIRLTRFPLLVKIIDAEKELSIQVHPDDYMASRRHGSTGKTEMWYTLAAADDACIYSGLQRSVTPEVLRDHIANGSVMSLLAKFKPVSGDYFYLPAGRIHSLGRSMVLEIQQPSDITYRIFDYNRPGLDGKMRDLHIDEALEATDFRVHEDYRRHREAIPGREQVLQECPHFIATVVNFDNSPITIAVSRYTSPRVLVATAGCGRVSDDLGNTVTLSRGHTLIVPATTPEVTLTPDTPDFEVVTAYIP
ncbi:MAG: class I mannose-6-phosphate isomerase [Muribaculaceae bacterium]|nr:class I mannose-6-phosphate isomerase [Muribaculaceae bacterium]